MNVFIPYPSPIDVAKCLDIRRLRAQINECSVILDTIQGYSTAWGKHPIMKMYEDDIEWLNLYKKCLECFLKEQPQASAFSKMADAIRPEWMTDELCDNHKRRLYTKAPSKYPQFSKFGRSYENWYIINGEIKKYKVQ